MEIKIIKNIDENEREIRTFNAAGGEIRLLIVKMKKEINLLKSNDEKDWSDLNWIKEFFKFLRGELPGEITLGRQSQPKLSHKKAFSIIWYLQEHFPILPDHIEKCSNCNELFDTDSEGIYWESKYKHFCGVCDYLVPENYDRGKR